LAPFLAGCKQKGAAKPQVTERPCKAGFWGDFPQIAKKRKNCLTPQPFVVITKTDTLSGGANWSMRCPKCGNQDDKVIDSRASREGSTIRRRRECLKCENRFTTYEEIEHEGLMVVKRDGRREEFSKDKLLSGLKKACQKRPISPKVIADLVEQIVDEVTDKYEREVPGMAIGERVMEELRKIDPVAYVRFASVYRRFEEATEFVREVKNLEGSHDSTQS
jgi:transcriptional repressor NrdR